MLSPSVVEDEEVSAQSGILVLFLHQTTITVGSTRYADRSLAQWMSNWQSTDPPWTPRSLQDVLL